MRIQAIRSSRIKWPLIASLSITVGFLLFAIPSHATVDWTEGFEYANQSAMNAVWTGDACIADASVMTPSTTRAFSGSRSLRMNYNGHQGITPSYHSCAMSRRLAAPTEVLYARWYMYMENFTVNSPGTKIMAQGPTQAYPSFWWVMLFGTPNFSVTPQGIVLADGTRTTVNLYGGAIPQNQWACLETRITMSSPGGADGIIQSWINGVQQQNITNQRMRGTEPIGTPPNLPDAKFAFVRLYTQHGVGNIYYDDLAVSRDARIGCTASPPPDRQAPRAPSGFSFR